MAAQIDAPIAGADRFPVGALKERARLPRSYVGGAANFCVVEGVGDGRVMVIGPIRQTIVSEIRNDGQLATVILFRTKEL